ncbi:NACHT domain-containing NTPase (plasmid) [Tolypothrix sp. PCC 7910]|uniref:NACHT domain-containing protein n=1 Tax=Tolypothrix sp. PCC 7910 TaxID=2099387 RepID=UPI001427864E|nr:NACHT domain-containing NTPase [Tolypothrix sp. PCC 7910]QIR41709.1 NACHT domain-containing NTPase [Tolypothrix sp. PCC 7910]
MPESEDQKEVSNTDLRNSQFGGGLINAETVNAQRIGGDIWNVFFGQQTTPIGNSARPKNERILLAAVKEEVTARLKQSLHNAVLINLGKESQPQQVKRPWDAEIKIGLKPAEPLPDTTTILQVFESEEIAGKLLVLGAPGSGKTTTQLELAQALISRAEEHPEYPVPVLFNLSSWKDDRQSLADWLVTELKSKYGVSTKLGQEWVDNHQLLPLLDGLDELDPQRQELCVLAINQFLTGETRPLYLVVCSRSEEYSNYATQLQLNGAIYLQPLTNSQICDYLTSINYIELWSTISSDLDLLELVKTPLLLSITVLASQGISVEKWQHLNSTADRIQYLLDAYVERMLTRDINSRAFLKNKPPDAKQTLIWLVWLAKQTQRESKTEFLIEEIQPKYLKRKSEKFSYYFLYTLSFFSIFWLSLALIVHDILTIVLSLIFVLFLGVITGLISGLVLGMEPKSIILVEKLTLFPINVDILLFSVFATMLPWMILSLSLKIPLGSFGLTLVIIVGLFYGSLSKEPDRAIENKKVPNQGIWKSAFNAIFLGFIAIVFYGLIYVFTHDEIWWLILEPVWRLVLGLILVLTWGLFYGGDTCIQHFALRLTLYFNGYIPWNYARFLNYCTERLFLQRVGGRYRFIHKLLQDHLAQMEFRRD